MVGKQSICTIDASCLKHLYPLIYHIPSAGDARNEVMTTRDLSKLKFDPSIYRTNALQGLVYDPARESRHINIDTDIVVLVLECVKLSGIYVW